MANRIGVMYDELEIFKEFLTEKGFEFEETKGKYEVLRARYKGEVKGNNRQKVWKKSHKPLIMFRRDRGLGFTLQQPFDDNIIFSFWNWKKERGN